MAVIPDGSAFGARTAPVSRRGVAQVRRTAVGDSIAQAGSTVASVGFQAYQREKANEGRLEYAKAKGAALRGQAELDASFDNDPDHETYEARYDEAIAGLHEDALKLVSDTTTRSLLAEELAIDRTTGRLKIGERAKVVERDTEIAVLNKSLATNRETYLAADPSIRAGLLEANSLHIQAAKERGFITAVQAEALERQTAQDYIEGTVLAMEPEARAEYLRTSKQATDHLPADRHADLLRQADAGAVEQRGVDAADDAIAEFGIDRKSVMKALTKIEDADERQAARIEANLQLSEGERAIEQAQVDVFDEMVRGMVEGKTLAQMKAADPIGWDGLTGTQQAQLAAAQSKQGKLETELPAYAQITDIWHDKGVDAARSFLRQNVGRFSNADFKKWEDRLVADDPDDPMWSDTQRLNSFAKTNAINDKDKGLLMSRYEALMDQYRRVNDGKEPDWKTRDGFLEDLMQEYVTGPGFFWGTKSAEGFKEKGFAVLAEGRDRDLFESQVKAIEAKEGRQLNDAEVERVYKIMKRGGMFLQ